MSDFQPLDMSTYLSRIQTGPCFICDILEGRDDTHHLIYRDEIAIAFLNKYPTLYGYVLVAPAQHREHVTGDFSPDDYIALQKVVYKVGEAVRREVPTERLYILSLGSQQGNRHVHWHIAPLPPGVPFEEQQLEALNLTQNGYLNMTEEEMRDLARRILDRISAIDQA